MPFDLDPVYYNPSTTPDDVQKAYQSQHEVMIMMLPPGAARTYRIPPPQVGLGHHGYTSRVPTPLSTDSPSDGSETSTRDSTSPTPHASDVYNLYRSLPRKS